MWKHEEREHEEFAELCTLALIGEVSPAEIEDLRHHLGECAACREQYREFTEFLLPQLSLALENDAVLLNGCTESERVRLRRDFLDRAQEKGFEFSTHAVRGSEEHEVTKAHTTFKVPPAVWQLALGVSLASPIFAGGYLTHSWIGRSLITNQEATHRASSPMSPVLPQSRPEMTPLAARNERDQKTIAELEQKLTETTTQLEEAEKRLTEVEASQGALDNQLGEKNKQISSLNAEVQGDAQISSDLRAQAANLKRRMDESLAALAASELHIRDLKEQVSAETASLDREREMLSVGRDVRDLMGARSLHIIDVHDANGAGKNQKSFGRIFYTEGKSLIFYAFDLDDKRVVNADYTYQAWGERLGQPTSVKSLGVLYSDDKAQRRWSLKVDDPHQLAEINSVFVTLEPHSGEGSKPRGKRILFAFLGGEANHP